MSSTVSPSFLESTHQSRRTMSRPFTSRVSLKLRAASEKGTLITSNAHLACGVCAYTAHCSKCETTFSVSYSQRPQYERYGDGGGDGGGDDGGDDAALGQGDEDEVSRGHPAGRAAAKAAGGSVKGKAPPAGSKKKWAFCGLPYPLAQLPWWRVE